MVQAFLRGPACECMLDDGSAASRGWDAAKKGDHRRTLRAMLRMHYDTAAVGHTVCTALTAEVALSWSRVSDLQKLQP